MKWIRWLGFGVGLLAASGCGGQVESPILTLQQLPSKRLSLSADRNSTGQGDIGVRVTVSVEYDTGGTFCGTLRSPGATLGGVKLALLSAGLKSYPPEYDGSMRCDMPTFQMQFGPNVPPGPLEVTDGITVARAEFDVLDPGTSVLVAPTDGTLHPGQSVRWHLNLPANAGLRAYRVYSLLSDADWAKGSAASAGGDVVATIPPSFPASYSGSGELMLLWTLDAHVTSCSAGFNCDLNSSALTGFLVTIHP